MTTYTRQQIAEILIARKESEEPDAILEILKKHDGKQLTKRLLSKLPGGEERWYIRHTAGMTNLTDRQYLREAGGDGFSFLIAYGTVNVMIDIEKILKQNACYFEARVARNNARDAAAKDPVVCQKMADAMNAYVAALESLKEATQRFDALTAYGQPFSHDEFHLERLIGKYQLEHPGRS